MESKKPAVKATDNKEKYFYGRGGRKTATARVRLFLKGKGEIIVNDLKMNEYFPTQDMQNVVMKPLVLTGHDKNTNLMVRVVGSGKIAQASAVRHGIARALLILNPELKPVLKAEGLLTRDPRVKERKKPGLKRARRAPQWAKR